MGKRIADHLHKYKKVTLGRNGYKVFKCVEAHCSHFIRLELAEGKLCKCNRCGNPMILTKIAMTLVKPHCPDCTRVKRVDPVVEALKEMFDE